MSASGWIMLSVIFAIVLLWIAGMAVTYTSLGDLPQTSEEKIEKRKAKWALALYSFNPATNLEKLFTVKEGGDKSLAVLNGVRVLSICWVVVGHGFSFIALGSISNIWTIDLMFKNLTFALVTGAEFAVDSFFFLSGFLTFYLLTMKMFPKRGKMGAKNIFLIYFHRYYRLIFPLLFVQFFAMFLMRYLGSGPMYR